MSVRDRRKMLSLPAARLQPLPSYHKHCAYQALQSKDKVLRLFQNQDHTAELLASKHFWTLLRANTSVSKVVVDELSFGDLHRLFLNCYTKHILQLNCYFDLGPVDIVLNRLMQWQYLTTLHLYHEQPRKVWQVLAHNTRICTLRITVPDMPPNLLRYIGEYLRDNKTLQRFELGATPNENTCQCFATILAQTTTLQIFSCQVCDYSAAFVTHWILNGVVCNRSLQKVFLESDSHLPQLPSWLQVLTGHPTIRYFKYGQATLAVAPDTLYQFQGMSLPAFHQIWVPMQWSIGKHHLYFEVQGETHARDWALHHRLFYTILLCLGRQFVQLPTELQQEILALLLR